MHRPSSVRRSRPVLLPGVVLLALALAALALAACGGAGGAPATPPGTNPPGAGVGPGSMRPPAPVRGLEPVGELEPARVVRVVDGDTLVIDRGRGNERLRYIGVDAPESVKPDTPVEFLGREASAANAVLVEGREVWLETDVSDRDRFDRLLRYVWVEGDAGWVLVNLELVRQGYANAVSFPPDVRWLDVLRDAERAARDAGRGLWGPPPPAP